MSEQEKLRIGLMTTLENQLRQAIRVVDEKLIQNKEKPFYFEAKRKTDEASRILAKHPVSAENLGAAKDLMKSAVTILADNGIPTIGLGLKGIDLLDRRREVGQLLKTKN